MSLREYRKWMYNKNLPGRNGLTNEFVAGVDEFIKFALSQDDRYKDGEKIRCPCKKCKNRKFFMLDEVTVHLYQKGFVEGYFNWTCHGEPILNVVEQQYASPQLPEQMGHWGSYEELNWDQRMVFDCVGQSFISHIDISTSNFKAGQSEDP